MTFFEVLIIALSLSMDAFAVSLAAGTAGYVTGWRAAFRLSFHFGLFQAMMPVLGWYLGTAIAPLIASFDHWVAFGLLVIVGTRMIRSGLSPDEAARDNDPTHGATLVMLSVATSIDALAVGLSLAMIGVTVWHPGVVIGLVTATMSLMAILVGARLKAKFGRQMAIVGGAILILIAARIVLSHTMG